MTRLRTRSRAARLAFALAPAIARAQEEPAPADAADALVADDSATLMDTIVVTGSHIRRIEVEGALPLTTIGRTEIERSGAPNVADWVRDLPYNSFGNIGDVPNSSTPNQAVPSLRGLGGKYTLTLLDGYRLPGVAYDFSGGASSVTGIPLAAIDRVDVLRDGASAIYGSETIGGVINLHTRREGVEPTFDASVRVPDEPGGGEWDTSFVAGARHDDSRWLFAAEILDRKALTGAERGYLLDSAPLSTSGNPGSFQRFDPETGAPVGPREADARCPDALGADPVFPYSVRTPFGSGSVCSYAFRAENDERAALRSQSVLGSIEADLTPTLALYTRLMAIENQSCTQLAPNPLRLTIAPDAPGNPTLGELGPGQGYPLSLSYRTSSLGPRVLDSDEVLLHGVIGLRGSFAWGDGGDWSLGLIANRLRSRETYVRGFALTDALDADIEAGRFDPFSAVPGDVSGLEDAAWTGADRSRSSGVGLEGSASTGVDLLDGNPTSLAFGFDLREDRFGLDYAPEIAAGNVGGGAVGAASESASRGYGAAYVEMLQPFGARWQLDAAVRYDRYEDAGGALSPKLALAFRPGDKHLLRASIGRGFEAPTLAEAYGRAVVGEALAVDVLACATSGDPAACEQNFWPTQSTSNAKLRPEHALQGNLGWFWQPDEDLDLGIDYYRIHIRDQIAPLDPQRALLAELACANGERTCDPREDGEVIRNEFGVIQTIVVPLVNESHLDTAGVDVELDARRETSFGKLAVQLRASRMSMFDVKVSDYDALQHRLGLLGTPRWRGTLGIDFVHETWGINLGVRYTDGYLGCDMRILIATGEANPACASRVRSQTELDAQWRLDLPWHARLALGARNLADRELPLAADGSFAYGLYDPIGRVWYVDYQQRF